MPKKNATPMKSAAQRRNESLQSFENTVRGLKLVSYTSILIGLIAIVISVIALLQPRPTGGGITTTVVTNAINQSATLGFINITSPLLVPQSSLPNAPVITQSQPFGNRLTNINKPLNATELAAFNNASNSYFETAGLMYLNKSITTVQARPSQSRILNVNGKPSVIYFGAISCIFCGENRWAMALALTRFGGFKSLYKGYSAIQDQDVPTLYWAPAPYNATSAVVFGGFYNSSYVNFLPIEYSSPISSGFQFQNVPYFIQQANSTGNQAYISSMQLINNLNNFGGTPYTIWGKFVVSGADAVDFGNSTPASGSLPITSWTHEQVIGLLAHPNSQFAWTEYAAADIYVALLCSSIKNTAPVCSLPAIQGIQKANGY